MTYLTVIRSHPITVAETQAFARSAEKISSNDERAELVDHVVHNPEASDVIPGTGGVRKMRWVRSGSDKRSGARVIYFYYRPHCPLYLLLAYAKAQATNLSADEKMAVAAFAATIEAVVDFKEAETMSDFGKELISAMEEAAAHAQGRGSVARVHSIEVPDVRSLREELGMSQQAFASAYRISLATLKGWEQGRRQPDATASVYLSVITRLPGAARDVLRAV